MRKPPSHIGPKGSLGGCILEHPQMCVHAFTMGTASLGPREFSAGKDLKPLLSLSLGVAIFLSIEMQNSGAGAHSSKPRATEWLFQKSPVTSEREEGGKENSVPWQKFGYPEAKGYNVTEPGFLHIQQALDGVRPCRLPLPSTKYTSGRTQRPGCTSWTLSPPECSSLRAGSGWCTQAGPSCCWGCARGAWRAH